MPEEIKEEQEDNKHVSKFTVHFKGRDYSFTRIKVSNEEDNPICLEEARNGLLQHYSSKSTNQTAILLGLAVAFFAGIQAYDVLDFLPAWIKITLLVSALAIIIFLLIRQVGRLIFWGELATASVIVEKLDCDTVSKWVDESRKEDPTGTAYPEPEDYAYAATYLHRISSANLRYFHRRLIQNEDAPRGQKGAALPFYRWTKWKGFEWIYLIMTITVLISYWSVVVWQFVVFWQFIILLLASYLSFRVYLHFPHNVDSKLDND